MPLSVPLRGRIGCCPSLPENLTNPPPPHHPGPWAGSEASRSPCGCPSVPTPPYLATSGTGFLEYSILGTGPCHPTVLGKESVFLEVEGGGKKTVLSWRCLRPREE